MGQLASLLSLLGAGTSLAGLGLQGDALRRITEYYNNPPGTIPTGDISPDEYAAILSQFPEFIRNSPQIQQALVQMGQTTPYGALAVGQIAADEQSRLAQLPYLDQIIRDIEGGASGAANRYFTDMFAGGAMPEAISQGSFDRMVAQAMDYNRAASASRNQQIENEAAARGLSVDAYTQLKQASGATEAEQNAISLRDLLTKREEANKTYGLQAAGLAAQVGDAYNSQLGAARLNRASAEQPVDLLTPAALGAGAGEARLGAITGAEGAFGNTLGSIGGGLLSLGVQRLNARMIADAQRGGLFGGSGGFSGSIGIPGVASVGYGGGGGGASVNVPGGSVGYGSAPPVPSAPAGGGGFNDWLQQGYGMFGSRRQPTRPPMRFY